MISPGALTPLTTAPRWIALLLACLVSLVAAPRVAVRLRAALLSLRIRRIASRSRSAARVIQALDDDDLLPVVARLQERADNSSSRALQPAVLLALHGRLAAILPSDDRLRRARLTLIKSLCSSPSELTELVNRERSLSNSFAHDQDIADALSESRALSYESIRDLDADFVLDVLWPLGLDIARHLPHWGIDSALRGVEACAALQIVLELTCISSAPSSATAAPVSPASVASSSSAPASEQPATSVSALSPPASVSLTPRRGCSFAELLEFIEATAPSAPHLVPLVLTASSEALRSQSPLESYLELLHPLRSSPDLAATVAALVDNGTPGSLSDLTAVARDVQERQ